MRSGRPWGALKGDDRARHDLARHLRGLVDHSELTLRAIGGHCGCSDTTVSKQLAGDQLPPWKFVEAVVEACTPDERHRPDRKRAVRELWQRAVYTRRVDPPPAEPGLVDAHTRLVRAQAETIATQRRLIEVTDELSTARRQLLESVQVEHRSSQAIAVLQVVLMRLSALISHLTAERDRHLAEVTGYRTEIEQVHRRLFDADRERGRAKGQLGQAKQERERAAALTELLQDKIGRLESRIRQLGITSPDPRDDAAVVPQSTPLTADEILLDTALGLDRLQRLLDAQGAELSELESANTDPVEPPPGPLDFASDARYRVLFTQSAIGMLFADVEGRILDVNQALQDMLGFSVEEMRLFNIRDLMHPEDGDGVRRPHNPPAAGDEAGHNRAEKRFLRADGEQVWTRLTLSLVRDDHGDPQYQVAMIEDNTDRHLFQNRLRYQALHDPLTGLPNRALFLERLGRVFDNRARHRAGLCYLDLDGFKVVNDSLGHDIGDQLLVEVGRRLDHSVSGEGKLVARMGGDEFVILVEDTTGVQTLVDIADRVLRELETPIRIGGHELTVSASIGIVERALSGTTAADLIRDADITQYWAKADGRARWALYNPERNAREVARFTLSATMPQALERGEFYVQYQPLVRLEDSTVVGVEALVRWQHPEFGRLTPDRFIELAEDTGLIVPLGRWVLRGACEQARRWLDEFGDAAPFVSVNLAVRQFRDPELVRDVERILDECALPPHHLQLELTESAIMGTADEPLETLRALSGLGVRIAIDGFGTGYSNLAYLTQLPVHELKIEGSFMAGLRTAGDEDPVDARIVSTLVQLAHALELGVTAKDIETREQAERLHRIGCDTGQGWFFAKPAGPHEIDDLLGRPLTP
ncbi:EAL domain-containing protein [Saccharothrix stipae]